MRILIPIVLFIGTFFGCLNQDELSAVSADESVFQLTTNATTRISFELETISFKETLYIW
jgi:hypothetical protein